MRRFIALFVFGAFALLTLIPTAPAEENDGPASHTNETPARRDARMQWWRDAKFGMFIHWGVYAVPAGEWQGRTNHAEWIRETARIPIDTYAKFLGQFNPEKYDAEQWVLAAKGAGMKYMVITSKHHDGFCLWPSKLTDYDIQSTPFDRDILGELKQACDKHGMKLGFYYSIMDWHHPNYPPRGWEKDRPRDQVDMDKYTAYMKGQLKELVENYDPVVLWFDGEWDAWSRERGEDLYQYVRSLKPDIIINNRVGKRTRAVGDFGTPEQGIPARGMPGWDWETCMTINNCWGWNKNDRGWKSPEDLIRKLIDIASKGGNYLLNVGPKPDGAFPDAAIERLRDIGQWMGANGEAIHGTRANPVGTVPWGRITRKTAGDRTRLYLHVFKCPPGGGELLVPGLQNKVLGARLLDGGKALKTTSNEQGVAVQVPEAAPSPIASVIVLEVQGEPVVVKPSVRQAEDGTLTLTALAAEIRAPRGVSPPQLEGGGEDTNLGFWFAPEAHAEWMVEVNKPGEFAVSAVVATQGEGGRVSVTARDAKTEAVIPNTGNYGTYTTAGLGKLNIAKAGRQQIALQPQKEGWTPINLRRLILTPVKP